MVREEKRLLEIKNLSTYFHLEEGIVKAVDDISFSINKGETLGVVGESGCGKSVTALSIMQLIAKPRGRIEHGTITYYGDEGDPIEITSLDPHGKRMRGIRGNEIAMIFQEPMVSLNPVYPVGEQIMEAVRTHQTADKKKARERALEMLEKVRISAPAQFLSLYPHELSGGMRQRVMIAMALSCNPSLLIADEPTTALDVTIEAQILDLIYELKSDFQAAVMFITHDLKVIGDMANRVIVIYAGKIVEKAVVDDIFYNPKHPYTQGLLESIPQIGLKKRLIPITGKVPGLTDLPKGCYFEPRCPLSMEICRTEQPPIFGVENAHEVKCWLYEKGQEVT
jgi:oligopeptide/dipeptide ABC transporter ATP-binding protein